MSKLYFYTKIFKNWHYLQDTGLLSKERIEQAIQFSSNENFGPVKLEGGNTIKNWVIHYPTKRMFHEDEYKKDSYIIYNTIYEDFFTEDEIEKLNKSASRIWSAKIEQQRFELAEKISQKDWLGPVYSEGHGYNDGYFESVDDFCDTIADDYWGVDFEYPKYLWACDEISICSIDLTRVIENTCQDAHDEFDSNDLEGWDELEKAVETFNELNKHLVNWNINYKKAIIL